MLSGETIAFLGEPNRETITDEELAALNGLKRGVLQENIDAGVEVFQMMFTLRSLTARVRYLRVSFVVV